ncbi:MAG TPA: hypothetical protein VMS18_28505 [Candidatus Binatia bacterium]|nr:hypothetical protein [Candidatus Binatia bacterium]
MRDSRCRPVGRLFYWAAIGIAALGLRAPAFGLPVPPQSGAGTTTVADTVYLADGTPASGNLIISWPSFVTTSGTAVASGSTAVTLGAKGALNVALVPNAGATPAGVYYSVVYQIGPGQVKTEYWVVPTASPASLATVRMTPGSGLAAQPVSMQYVNSALATKADDTSVVHLNGSETISGTKTFASAPDVPAPSGTASVANKAYVDQAVANVGAGNYLSIAGGTMTGPINLPGNPSAPLQATPKQYVDAGFTAKADLAAGLVPASELGAGTATAGACLLGSGTSAATWGACGGGGGTGNVSTAPVASQNVVQPVGTQFSINNLANARYVTSSWSWVQTPSDNLGTAGSNTIHLSPCPLGIDTSNNANAQYAVYIAGTGTSEAAPVTGGTCTPGGGSGTITVTTAYSHTAGYTVGSATSGIQEAINDSGTQRGTIYLLPASSNNPNYKVYSSVFLNSKNTLLSGYGALVQCFTRAACIIDGNYLGTNGQNSTIAGIEFMPGLNLDGVQIASISASGGTYTITTATNHSFVVGDYVVLFYSSASQTQEGRFKVTSVPAANQFSYSVGTGTIASVPAYGWAAIENTAIEDISNNVTVRDIKIFSGTSLYFHWGIVVGNDQSFKLDGMTLNGGIRCGANFCGALVYARGDQGAAPVVTIEHMEASMQCGGNGVRYASGNTLHVMNSVVQGFNQYGIYYAGGLQKLMIGGTYQESSGTCSNPAYPGTLSANAGIVTNSDLTYIGDDPIGGAFPAFVAQNPGSQVNNYFVVIHSSIQGNLGMFYIGGCSTTGTGNCTTYWPEINVDGLGSVTYDVLKTVGTSAIPPNGTGSYAVATGISGSCNTAGVCTKVDAQTGTSNYTVSLAQQVAKMNFWPGALVLGGGSRLQIENCGQAAWIIATTYLPSVYCKHSVPGSGGSYTPYWAIFQAGDSVGNNNPGVGAILEQGGPAAGSALSGLTGLRGFLSPGSLGQTDMYTFAYTNPFLTLATPGYRPAASSTDTAIGFDSAPASVPTSAQLGFRAPVAISEYIGNVFDNTNFKERLTATSKTFNVPVTINGNLTVTGTCAGCGGGSGGGSGIVNSGNASQIAMYSASGAAVSGDSALTDTGTTLNYSGSGGISASGGTFSGGVSGSTGTFSGNLSVGGQLIVTGPWLVNSPIPTAGMGAGTTGTSSLGISNDGNFYISANAGTPSQVQTAASVATALAGYVPTTTTVNGHPLSGNVTVSAAEITAGTLPHAQLPPLVSGDIPNNAANTTGSAASLSAVSALPNGTTASTQTVHDNSTKVATTAYVDAAIAGVSTSWLTPISAANNGAYPSSAANKCLMWGFTLPVSVQTSQISYYIGANPDSSGTYNYDLGIFNAAGTLVLNVSAGSLHGSTFAPATGVVTMSWAQGSTLLQPGAYYVAYYSSNTTATPPTLYGASGNAPVFYKAESGSGGAQGSNGFVITPRSGGILPSSISAPAANGPQASYMPMFWLH